MSDNCSEILSCASLESLISPETDTSHKPWRKWYLISKNSHIFIAESALRFPSHDFALEGLNAAVGLIPSMEITAFKTNLKKYWWFMRLPFCGPAVLSCESYNTKKKAVEVAFCLQKKIKSAYANKQTVDN